MTWLKSAEVEINATARNLTVKKLPLTKLRKLHFMILAGSFLLPLLLLLHYLILSSKMDVNLIGSKQIFSDAVRYLLVVVWSTHLLNVLQKVKLNAQQTLILSIQIKLLKIGTSTNATARNPEVNKSIQTNITMPLNGDLAE
jgi:hypothetical protein